MTYDLSDVKLWCPFVRHLPLPYDRSSHKITPRMVMLHTNAGGPVSVDSFNASMVRNAPINPETTIPHFQIAIDGDAGQFLPLNIGGVTCFGANSYSIGIETADHGAAALTAGEPWTSAQVATIGHILAWIATATGIPLARPTSWQTTGVEGHCSSQTLHDGRGFNYPNTSSARGKLCPTFARIAQIDGLLTIAKNLNTPATPVKPPVYVPPPTITGDSTMYHVYTNGDADGLGEWLLTPNGIQAMSGPFSEVVSPAMPKVYADKRQMRGLFGDFGQPIPPQFL